MIIKLDTNNYEGISLAITDEERENGTVDLIQEFCYAMAALFTDFSMELSCDIEQAKGLKDVCLSCIERDIDSILDEGVLEDGDDDEDIIDAEEINELKDRLTDSGFDNEEIQNIISLVENFGGIENASAFLKSIGDAAGIDWDAGVSFYIKGYLAHEYLSRKRLHHLSHDYFV